MVLRVWMWVAVVLSAVTVGMAKHGFANERFLCTADSVIGYSYDHETSTWHPTVFKTVGKYEFRPFDLNGRDKQIAALIKADKTNPEMGFFDAKDDTLEATCSYMRDKILIKDYICKPFLSIVDFNENNSAFQMYYEGSYLSTPDMGPVDTPSLSIGHCIPIHHVD